MIVSQSVSETNHRASDGFDTYQNVDFAQNRKILGALQKILVHDLNSHSDTKSDPSVVLI